MNDTDGNFSLDSMNHDNLTGENVTKLNDGKIFIRDNAGVTDKRLFYLIANSTDTLNLSLNKNFSIAFYYNVSADIIPSLPDNTIYGTIISKTDGEGDCIVDGYQVYFNQNNSIQFDAEESCWTNDDVYTFYFPSTEMSYIVITHNISLPKNQSIKLYMNGINYPIDNYVSYTTEVNNITNNVSVNFGMLTKDSYNSWSNGTLFLKNFGYWNKTLNDNDILTLYNRNGNPLYNNETYINSCGNYYLNNTNAYINFTNATITNCIIITSTNSNISCIYNINTTVANSTFITINYTTNTIYENCNLSFFQVGLSYNIASGISDNNIIRNIKMKDFGAGLGTGIYLNSASSSRILNNTEIYNIDCYNITQYCISLRNSPKYNIYIHDINITGNKSTNKGLYLSNIINLTLNNINMSSSGLSGSNLDLYILSSNYSHILNSNFIGYAILESISLFNSNETYFYNVNNNVNNVTIPILKFKSIYSTIDQTSTYNLGWFPSNYTDNNVSNYNKTSLYNVTNSWSIVNMTLVKNYSIRYFTFPICEENWSLIIKSCQEDGTKLISYIDVNDCRTYIQLPLTNNTYESCIIPSTEGEINIVNALNLIALVMIAFILVYIFKSGDKK
jgi:hypothetical protein